MGVSERVARLRQVSLEAKPCISAERAALITDFYEEDRGTVSAPVRRALAFRHLLENKAICILEGELIVGERGPAPKATPTYPEVCCHSLEDLDVLVEAPFEKFPVSALTGEGIEDLRRRIFDLLRIVRVYSKIPGKKADRETPFILKKGSNLRDAARAVHKDFADKLSYARVWNRSGLEGLRVNRDYVLRDEDILELHI